MGSFHKVIINCLGGARSNGQVFRLVRSHICVYCVFQKVFVLQLMYMAPKGELDWNWSFPAEAREYTDAVYGGLHALSPIN